MLIFLIYDEHTWLLNDDILSWAFFYAVYQTYVYKEMLDHDYKRINQVLVGFF